MGTLPRVFEHGQVRAYPALADDGDSVAVRLFETRAQADASMRRGTRRLILLQVTTGARGVASRLPVSAKLAMSRAPYPGAIALLDDCAACAADEIIAAAGGPAWDEAGFARLLEAARLQLATGTARVVSLVAKVLGQAQETETALSQARSTSPAMSAAISDMRAQLAGLIYAGFVSDTGSAHLADLVRYLRGISWRLERAPGGPGPRRRADGGRARGDAGLAGHPQGAGRHRPVRGRGPAGPVADRGAAGQPVRPDPGHAGAGV